MADPFITQEQAQLAKVAASGAFGGAVLVFLRHPGSILRVALMIGMGIGFATIFAADLSITLPFVGLVKLKAVQVAALWGLLGKTVADALVRAAEKRLDFTIWFDRGKPRQDEQIARATEHLKVDRDLERMAAAVDRKLEGDAP